MYGSHIAIRAPIENHASYVNRKSFHSVILQAVCDEKREFTHCYDGAVGSVHDACVFRRSNLLEEMNVMELLEYHHLLGDSAYPLSKHVLVPYKDNGHYAKLKKTIIQFTHQPESQLSKHLVYSKADLDD